MKDLYNIPFSEISKILSNSNGDNLLISINDNKVMSIMAENENSTVDLKNIINITPISK